MLLAKLIENIIALEDCHTGSPLTKAELIRRQKELVQNGFPQLPPDFIAFLCEFNGLSAEQGVIFGFSPTGTFIFDILRENILLEFPRLRGLLVLGTDEFYYLAYAAQTSRYQIIDKDTLEVLQTYPDAASALEQILKTDNEQYL